MHKDLRAYLINRLEILDEEIGIKEREYKRIVKLLLDSEEEMEKEKKVNFDKEVKKILKTGKSYKEYQIEETKKIVGMSQKDKEEDDLK